MKKISIYTLILFSYVHPKSMSQVLFEDSFDKDLSGWEINNSNSIRIKEIGDDVQGNVLVLKPNGKVTALIKNSEKWGAIRVTGKMHFPRKENNYLGFIYNYNKSENREDFGLLYVKGNGSYIRVNPWRDGNVSRLMYEEYKTKLKGDDSIKIGEWVEFKMEVKSEICHLYIGDMSSPKITFDLFEFNSGKIGFQPRVVGGEVWIDDIKVESINRLGYRGKNIPNILYEPDSLITQWDVIGPFNKPQKLVETAIQNKNLKLAINGKKYKWERFLTDKRGAIITGKITEFEGENTIAYFRTMINSQKDQTAKLHFTTTDELTLYLNGKNIGRVYRDGYISKNNDWNAWFDFWKNPEHEGRKVKIPLITGKNQLVIKVRNGQFASGGFFVSTR